jgi:hypothetical protein
MKKKIKNKNKTLVASSDKINKWINNNYNA